MNMLDLCCGSGGVSDGAGDAGWTVYGVDVEYQPAYRHLFRKADVRTLSQADFAGCRFDWVHASPPCQRFSLARGNRVKDPPTEADLDILRACLRIRDELQPTFWSVENVRGAVSWFRPILGEPTLRHGAFFLWGNFPPFLCERQGLVKGISGNQSKFYKKHGKSRNPGARITNRTPVELTRPLGYAIAQAVGNLGEP